ncbi:MAG: DMT family transporter [Bacteroidetes bacterium]|nr:DMT family transporter [Bacteroidota bacterium]
MQKAYVHIAAILSMIFWGFSFILSKTVFELYTPLTTIFFRLVISSIFLFPLIKLTGKFEKIDRKDFGLLIGGAFFNPFLYFIGENYGLDLVSVSISAIIIATIPVFTAIVALKMFAEKLSSINIFGMIISFFGLTIILVNKEFKLDASPSGIALLFLAVISAVIYTVYIKKLTLKYKPITIITWQNLAGALFFLPFFILFDFKEVMLIKPDIKTILSLVGLGVLCSSAAYILFIYAIKHLGISKSNLYTNLIPVIASLAAFFLLKEDYSWQKASGMGVVIIGVMLSQFNRNSRFFNRRKL